MLDKGTRNLTRQRHLGHAERVPEADARPPAKPCGGAPATGERVRRENADANDEVHRFHRGGIKAEGRPNTRPKKSDLPLSDAENHYVATQHKVG
jgi:hypothetical protein